MSKTGILKTLDESLGPLCCRILSQPQRDDAFPAPDRRLESVLIIRPGGIGDAVMLLPAISALRMCSPLSRIEILCESRNSAVFRMAFPELPVYEYDSNPFSVLRRLAKVRYSAVVDTEQFHHFSGVMAALTKASTRVGFKINTKRNALYTHLVSYDLDGPEDSQFLRLFSTLTGRSLKLPERFGMLSAIDLPELSPEIEAAVSQMGNFIVMHVGGSSSCKRWDSGKYAGLASRLRDELGLASVIVGGASEKSLAAEVMNCEPSGVLNLCGDLSLGQTGALCRRAGLFIGPDSGIAHLACAFGSRCVVLFGPSDSGKWGPGDSGISLTGDVPCGPCAIFGYNKPCETHLCMRMIQPDKVYSAVEKLTQSTKERKAQK